MILALAIALVVTAACPVFTRFLGRGAGYPLALGLLAAAALLLTSAGDLPTTWSTEWLPSVGVSLALRLDGLSLLFGLLVTVIGALIMIYSARYLGGGRHTSFYLLMSGFAAAMLTLVLADDIVLLFLAWEATTYCSFFLIARSGEHARTPAIRTLLVTAAGGLALLGAVVLMAVTTGTTRLSTILEHEAWQDDPSFVLWATILLAIAAFTKSAQFPFQSWLPDSMVAITPVSAYLHAAAMVKAGIYLILRFSPALAESTLWSTLLITSGLITALIGAISAVRRTDLKGLLASSTVSQLGLIVAMVGVGTPEALTAAVTHTLAHAVFKAALFMGVGILDHEAGTREIGALAEKRLAMPVTRGLIIAAAASMAAVPPLLGFVSKEGMLTAMVEAPGPAFVPVVVTAAAVLTSVFTVAYSGRIVLGSSGTRASGAPVVGEAPPAFWVAPAVSASVGLIGIAPFLLDPLLGPAAQSAVGPEPVEVHLALWHGFNLPLALSALVLALGLFLIAQRRAVDRLMADAGLPVDGLAVVDAAREGVIRAGAVVSSWTRSRSPWRHLAIQMSVLVVIAAALLTQLGDLPEIVAYDEPWDWLLLLIVAASVAAVLRTVSRVGAVVVVGVSGFTVMLWFYSLGAPDVALTQLLVEFLTVSVMVLLLRRLPKRFVRTPRGLRPYALVLAVASGAVTAIAVWVLTGRRGISEAGQWYLENGQDGTGATNLVNSILVDYRALDTLGELTVLGMAGVAIVVLLQGRRATPDRRSAKREGLAISDAAENSVFARTVMYAFGPLVIALSVYLLLRGHYEPGGGFIAALVGGAGVALLYLAASSDERARIRGPYLRFIGLGVVIGVATGFLGFVGGSFLTPIPLHVGPLHLSSALIFDVGVYLAVIGVVVAAFTLLGTKAEPPERQAWEADDPSPESTRLSAADAQEVR